MDSGLSPAGQSTLLIDPCIPRGWPSFEITFRYRSATYEISVENPLGVCRGILATKLDGEMQKSARWQQIVAAAS